MDAPVRHHRQAGIINPASTLDLPASITCFTSYRPRAGSNDDAFADRIVIERCDGMYLLEGPSLSYPNLQLKVEYSGDAPEGHFVSVNVSDLRGNRLLRALYQYANADALRNDLGGGHGFTGLNYFYRDGAELQYWCSVEASE
ncbi:hypothetical protein [Rathayibacter sp. VKM Ac-2927]|uniref:hypothetical protein n=1 Tax=Rathayibacter sp. VKM Ac-2927 TaxID=2929478 RepID=UPI001FB3585C|nr:hypothetical protein [Rathayibacter sp. VKM Ac-2927]MCJ1688553.1 hypothetical protein [Rathayibacter sp. VKM Ac-2927]